MGLGNFMMGTMPSFHNNALMMFNIFCCSAISPSWFFKIICEETEAVAFTSGCASFRCAPWLWYQHPFHHLSPSGAPSGGFAVTCSESLFPSGVFKTLASSLPNLFRWPCQYNVLTLCSATKLRLFYLKPHPYPIRLRSLFVLLFFFTLPLLEIWQ